MDFTYFLLISAIILYISLIASKASSRFGVPALLFFLLIGVLFGNYVLDGNAQLLHLKLPKVEILPQLGQDIGIFALIIILFSGGLDTSMKEIKPIAKAGILMATVGVLLTTLLTAVFIYLITNSIFQSITFSFAHALLLSSIVSSTDSASVFGILRGKNIALKENLRPLLELESGSNDPMAFLLVIVCIQYITTPQINIGATILLFLWQLIAGTLGGIFLGKLAVRLINKIDLDNAALYSVLLLVIAVFIYSFTDLINGNGCLAVYFGGLMIGNRKIVHKRSSMKFFDGLTWLFQIIIFLVLGFMLKIDKLGNLLEIGLVIGLGMVIIIRPLVTLLCLIPFVNQFSWRAKLYTSWVGLRGAVPIIFATYPLVANVEYAQEIFCIVFLITITSLLLQGTTIPILAQWLNLSDTVEDIPLLKEFDVEFSDEIKSIMREITITENMLKNGSRLMDIPLPESTLVAIVKRHNNYFIPRGSNHLEVGDSILIITDNENALKETYRQLEIGS